MVVLFDTTGITQEEEKLMNWGPWTGCYPESTGCDNCYFYGPNAKRFGQNIITKTLLLKQINSTGLFGEIKKANITLKVTKSLPPALQQTFFYQKLTSGEAKFGR